MWDMGNCPVTGSNTYKTGRLKMFDEIHLKSEAFVVPCYLSRLEEVVRKPR